MKLSHKGTQFITRHEGIVLKWYRDPVGVGTIGIGFTWRSTAFKAWWKKNKPNVHFGPGANMTREECAEALKYLVDREYGKAVNDFMRKDMPQHRFDAMCSVVYNCGPGALGWKWAKLIKSNNVKAGAARLKVTAVTAKGKRLPGLVRRRKEEAELVLHDYGKIYQIPVKKNMNNFLRRHDEGQLVAKLITDLATLGYYDQRIDDIFGPATEKAVMEFQRSNGLDRDGVVGPLTAKAIQDRLADLRTSSTVPKTNPVKASWWDRWLKWLKG